MTLASLFLEKITPTSIALKELQGYLFQQRRERVYEKNMPSLQDASRHIIAFDLCTAAEKNDVSEEYLELRFGKDVIEVKESSGQDIQKIIRSFEKQNCFLPSMPLTCTLLSTLYKFRSDSYAKKILLDYINPKQAGVWFRTDSSIDWGVHETTHYNLQKKHLSVLGDKTNAISSYDAVPQPFTLYRSQEVLLQTLLKENESFVKNITGLTDPEILCSLARTYGKEMKVYLPEKPYQETKKFPLFFGSAYNSVYITLNTSFREYNVRWASDVALSPSHFS